MRIWIFVCFLLAGNCCGTPVSYEIPYSENEPVMDGVVVGDPIWEKIPAAGDFKVFKTLVNAEKKTSFKALFSDKGLWVGVVCEEPGPVRITEPDNGAVWNDDCVEIFIASQKNKYRHFIVNAGGKRANQADDIDRVNVLWDWSARTARSGGGWSVEIFIPAHLLDDFEYRPGEIGFNIGRTSTSSGEISSWAGQSVTFHRMSSFGKLKFGHILPDHELAAIHEEKQIGGMKQQISSYAAVVRDFYEQRQNSSDGFLKKCAAELAPGKKDFDTYVDYCLNNCSTENMDALRTKGEKLKEKFRLFETGYQKKLLDSMQNN